MRTSLTTLCLLLLLAAQGQLRGRVQTIRGTAIQQASIALKRANDSMLIRSSLSDDSGQFQIRFSAKDTGFLEVTAIGYGRWFSAVIVPGLGEIPPIAITLQQHENEMSAVEVRAKKNLYQPVAAGLVMQVEASILSKGNTALQVLEKAPGVRIDQRNAAIALNGRDGVLVMINGNALRLSLEQLLSMLGGMAADDVEKIELFTHPPASYDAEGAAGVINIVLKKNRRMGNSGALTLMGGYGWGEKAGINARVARNIGKTNLSASYNFSHDKTYSDLYIESKQDMPMFSGRLSVLTGDTTSRIQNNHDLQLGLEHKLNESLSVGGNLILSSTYAHRVTNNYATYHLEPDSILHYQGKLGNVNDWKNLMGSIFMNKRFSEKTTARINLDYLTFRNKNNGTVNSSLLTEDGDQAGKEEKIFAPQQRGNADTRLQVYVGKLDWVRRFGSTGKWESGFKGSYTNVGTASALESQVNGDWVIREETVTAMTMRESIVAAYSSVAFSAGEKSTWVIGARIEGTAIKLDHAVSSNPKVHRKYWSLFPNISFTRKVSAKLSYNLSYVKRITRPSYNDLASYTTYSDPTAVYTGNPLLQPTISHNLKAGIALRSFNLSLQLARDEHPIARYQLTESPQRDLLYVSPQNLSWQNYLTLQAGIPIQINSWWSMDANWTGGYRQFQIDYTRERLKKTYFSYSANINHRFQLPSAFSMELGAWYNAASYNGTVRVSGFGALNAGVKKELPGNAGSIQFGATDILRSIRIRSNYGTLTREAFDASNFVDFQTEGTRFPILKLSYTKTFGYAKPRAAAVAEPEEKERVRKD